VVTSAFELADRFVDDVCEADPILCTFLGVPGSDDRWGSSLGLEGLESRRDSARRYRPEIAPLVDSADPRERVTARVMLAAIDEGEESYQQGDHFLDLRHMASGFQRIRSVFDVMRTETDEDWDNIVARLEKIDQPLSDYRDLLRAGLSAGVAVASRQVESVVDQARRLSAEESSFNVITRKAGSTGHESGRLSRAVEAARSTVAEFGEWLEQVYLPSARSEEGFGRDAYERAANRMVGMRVDPDEAYEWGWEEFRRLRAEMERVAAEILPDAGIAEVTEYLETDPAHTAAGTEALIAFVEEILATAVDELAGRHFEVADVIRPLTVQIAPPGGPLGVYYLRPSEDFTRPGGVWYSIGDQEVFPLYQHVSTAYHEGFPGHHLQLATAMYQRDNISRFQRLLTWCPGYGEGWGMYAEVLMGELGYLEDPSQHFGMLAKQMYRAARVVVDIGLHLGLRIDAGSPVGAGLPWSFERAIEFMEVFGFRTPAQARDEVLRYLGWPGQAIAYKLGEREILRIRADTEDRLRDRFDLKEFHSVVINNGTMRLDLLDEVVKERLDE